MIDRLDGLEAEFLLTYDDAPETRELYEQYHIEQVTLPKIASNVQDGIREYCSHLLITSYKSDGKNFWRVCTSTYGVQQLKH